LVELVALLLIGGVITVYLFVRNITLAARNRNLQQIVKKQNHELDEIRDLMVKLDQGENMQQLLEEVHQHALQTKQLERLRYT
jgi:hypothetical protein